MTVEGLDAKTLVDTLAYKVLEIKDKTVAYTLNRVFS